MLANTTNFQAALPVVHSVTGGGMLDGGLETLRWQVTLLALSQLAALVALWITWNRERPRLSSLRQSATNLGDGPVTGHPSTPRPQTPPEPEPPQRQPATLEAGGCETLVEVSGSLASLTLGPPPTP